MLSELGILQAARGQGKKVFSIREIAIILNYKGDMSNLNTWIKRLKDRGLVRPIKRGSYVFAQEEMSNFEYSNALYAPSYISRDSALNYYGMLPQVPLSVTAMTLKRAKVLDYEGVAFDYSHISPKYYWGYENVGNVLIADREKALIDKVYSEAFIGKPEINFIDELNLEDVSREKLIKYASTIENKAFSKLIEAVYVKF